MKKVLVILTLALFLGGIGASAIASTNNNFAQTELQEEKTRKKDKKSEKKAEAAEKSSDCTNSCKGEKKSSDCSKK